MKKTGTYLSCAVIFFGICLILINLEQTYMIIGFEAVFLAVAAGMTFLFVSEVIKGLEKLSVDRRQENKIFSDSIRELSDEVKNSAKAVIDTNENYKNLENKMSGLTEHMNILTQQMSNLSEHMGNFPTKA